MSRPTLSELPVLWRKSAQQHADAAAECYDRSDDNEGDMNAVEAHSLRRCAAELEAVMPEIENLRCQLVKRNERLAGIADDLRDNYPAVDVTTVVFSGDWARVGCCVIPQDRVLEIIAALTKTDEEGC